MFNLFKEKMIGEVMPYSKATAKKNPSMVRVAFKSKIENLENKRKELNDKFKFITLNFDIGSFSAKDKKGDYSFWQRDDYGDWNWNNNLVAVLKVNKNKASLKIRPEKIQKLIQENQALQEEIDNTSIELGTLKKEQKYFEKKFLKNNV